MADVANADVAGGQTASNFYAALIAELGATVSSVTAANTAQQAALTALQQQNAAVSSVSLDEEASNLTEYERAYQAASQMFNVVDTVMTSALNLGVQTAVS
jgi:flagellar hook-associated protein 1 FlgK